MATKYYQTILVPAHPLMGVRNGREVKTISRALDLLAQKETGAAADLLAQRLKALERSMVDGHWERAQWAELLPPEGVTLMDREEDQMLAREEALAYRLRGRGTHQHQGSYQNQGYDKGSKGKGKSKKDRDGEKGKGKNQK